MLTQRRAGETTAKLASQTNAALNIAEGAKLCPQAFGWPMKRGLYKVFESWCPDIVHDHGMWLPANYHVARVIRQHDVPLVIHARGMLEPWALQHRGWKKRVALWAYQRRTLETAAVFFATAEQEAYHLRQMGLRQPIAVVPNAVVWPELPSSEKNRNPGASAERKAVFLGRIHPIKGLLNLLEAWARLRPRGWRLALAGPDEDGHLAQVLERAHGLGLDGHINYLGSVDDDEKAELLATADLFMLPSFSENFGVVVAEALSFGVPVITTQGTPWKELVSQHCGWWVEPSVDGISGALTEAIALDDAARQKMGANGRSYAQSFQWPRVARQTAAVYRWLLGQGPRPECVLVE